MGFGKMKTVRIALAVAAAAVFAAMGPSVADEAGSTVTSEEAFLDILPKVSVPEDVQPIAGAVNEEFRNCRAYWPEEYSKSQRSNEARAYRDIYGFVKVRNVIETRDCSCSGKIAAWPDVEYIAAKLRETQHVSKLGWQQTKEIFDASNRLFPVAEVMCGGRF